MDERAIAEEACRLATKGADFRTIQIHFEEKLGHVLVGKEGDALLAGWRASAPARIEREKARAAKVAASLRQR